MIFAFGTPQRLPLSQRKDEPMDSNDDTDCNTDSNNATVTEAEAKIAMLTGVAHVDIIEHKRLSAQGKFKAGVERPLKYIIMG